MDLLVQSANSRHQPLLQVTGRMLCVCCITAVMSTPPQATPQFCTPLLPPPRITDQALDQLMGMAEDMGDELATQNKQLDRINAKAEVQDRNISEFNRRIHKQLK